MPCNPLNDSEFNLPSPSFGSPGAGSFAIQIPSLNIPFPPLPIEDLLALFDKLSFILPPGTLKPHFEPNIMKSAMSGIYSILEKFMPFLMLYKFFLPVLNLILCIIEILCSLFNPFKTSRAISRLFRVCIPEFLALFPFFALVIMIISLLLLLLALIEYLLQRILDIIALLLQNIEILVSSTARLDNDSVVAIIKKIGDLLCILQNLFALFGVFALIIEIIKNLLSLGFRIPPCDSTDGSSDGCCTPDVCPAFIKNNTTITNNSGNFAYINEVSVPSGIPHFNLVSIERAESWQFYDASLISDKEFINITNAFDLPSGTTKVFFAPGVVYNSSTDSSSVPYTIDFRILYSPTAFNRVDQKGSRFIRITNAIIQNPPISGVINYNNNHIGPFNGTLNLVGGKITEDDGITPINMNINQLFHNNPIIPFSNDPLPNNTISYKDITYTFKINHEVLVGYNLITLGCIPTVALNRNFINATIGAQFNLNGINLNNIVLPDVNAAQACVLDNVNALKQSISADAIKIFQTNITACLNDLAKSTTTALTQAVGAGFDQYKSDFTLDPEIQFTTGNIKLIVSLKEGSGNLITNNLPLATANAIASELNATITFGNISPFIYDGAQFFIADITSLVAGNGIVKVLFNNNYISILNNPANIDQVPSVSIKELSYTFVDTINNEGEPRRDAGDISRD